VNGEAYVSHHVRQRVLDAVRELGYRRNTTARALHTGRFQRLGVVALGSPLYGPSSMLFALERAARTTGYSLSLVSTLEGEPFAVARAVESLLVQGVDGIILSEPIDEGEEVDLDVGVPVLNFGRMRDEVPDNVIVTDFSAAAQGRQATDYLLGLGHSTVWHVAGPQSWWAARERLGGWREALERAGAPVRDPIEGDWTPASGFRAGERLARQPGVTAIFAASDDMAIGVLRALAEAGIEVPGQVSVVGLDDIPAAAFLTPRLTTVRNDIEAAAATGLAQLLDAIAGTPVRAPQELPAGLLVVRDSTAAPRRTRPRRSLARAGRTR